MGLVTLRVPFPVGESRHSFFESPAACGCLRLFSAGLMRASSQRSAIKNSDGFALKDDFPFNCLTSKTILYPEKKWIFLDEPFGMVDISYITAPVNDGILDIDNISQEYVGTVHLYYDDGPYTDGPEFSIDTLCWVYRHSTTTWQGGTRINENFKYFFPMGQTSIILRSNTFSGQGYHGGHMIIRKDDTDNRFGELRQIFNGKRLVQSKSKDEIARAFEIYCIRHAETLTK